MMAGAVEMILPITKTLEASLAGRYEKYSDYGNDFAPKAAIRWQPSKTFTLRASAGTGFGAPSLPILTQKDSFSAESVLDAVTCVVFGGQSGVAVAGRPATPGLTAANDCSRGKQVQVDTYTAANGALKSEKSNQFAIGAVWDPLPWLSAKVDYASIKIKDKISLIGASTLLDRDQGSDPRAIPAGLFVKRESSGAIDRIQQGYANEGTIESAYLDMSVQAKWKQAGWGSFDHELRFSRLMKYNDDGDELKGTLGLPEQRATLGNQWRMGNFTAALNFNYIGQNGTAADRTAGAYVTQDIQGSWSMAKNTKLTFGVVNVGGKMPELVAFDGRNFNFNLYDSYGRQPYVRLDHKF